MIQPICVTGIQRDTISLKINGFKEGYKQLTWTAPESEDINVAIINKYNTIKIKDIIEGLYEFTTTNTELQISSEPMSVYIQIRDAEDQIDRLWSYAEVDTTDTYFSDIKTMITLDYDDSSLLYCIYQLYNSIVEKQDFENEFFFKLITIQEKLENLQLATFNRGGICFAKLYYKPMPVIEFSDEVDTIKIYELGKEKKLIQVYHPLLTTQELRLPEGFFEIHLLAGADLLTVLRHCQMDSTFIATMWQQQQSQIENYLNTVEDDFQYSADMTSFSIQEKTWYMEELLFAPKNPILPRIQVTESDVTRSVKLSVTGIGFAQTSEHNFYIGGCDAEFLQDTVDNKFFRFPNTGNSFSVNFEPVSNMIDSMALLYIVDENNNIVSRATRCLFDEDWTTTIAPYNEKVRVLEVTQYSKRLLRQLQVSYPAAHSFVKNLLDGYLEDETVNMDNILSILLSDCATASNEIVKDQVTFEILKDWFASFDYDMSFFSDGGFSWAPYSFMVTSEESEDGYVLCIMAKEQSGEEFVSYYIHSKPTEAIQVQLNRLGQFVVYAISEKDYKQSGFLYINTITGYQKSYLLRTVIR